MEIKIPPANIGILNENRKRKRIVSSKECQFDMKDALRHMFSAFNEAVQLYNLEIGLTNPQDRVRSMEASYFNSKLIQCLRSRFKTRLKRGKYGRIILYENGYVVLFKKLGKNDKPMNIRTKVTDAIENQLMGNLFNKDEDGSSPIIFFGYSKTKFGEIAHPRIVYIDENLVKWTINENDITPVEEISLFGNTTTSSLVHATVKPMLKIKKKVE